ncbi:MAG TPA: NAD(P)H-dependent oxidoreductase [Bacillales bacterium]|nr:NAD(P)H-dependent oxidoreductase [Bacillales bacterium]
MLASDFIVIIHPNWWGQPPAILKGWVDRVFKEGEIYTVNKSQTEGKLKNKKALIISTSNISNDKDRELYGDPILNFWGKIVFKSSGIEDIMRINFDQIVMSSESQRKQWLDSIDEYIHTFLKSKNYG